MISLFKMPYNELSKYLNNHKEAVATHKTVIVDDEFQEDHSVEITTYRSEEEYVSGRWPSKVIFGSKLEDDLERRDFTINAMAIDFRNINFQDLSYNFIRIV